ncbi:MOSC domain-containing protein [Microbulbifer epialgicus]|uniref:MOSC domain-containing protein n=1 Tax=Microbulbifer epialgicus TaxID=393907 RepID=A0ABV4P7A0_9GAMM
MKLISINVSRKVLCLYKSKTVTTGIFKKPTQESILVTKTNLEGDEQADLKHHGGTDMAVYAYSYDHFSRWEEQLGRNEIKYGSFGENLTVEGLQEQEIFIGDRFRLGNTILEVSQPRIPCFKLNMALDNDLAVKILTNSFNSGVYFRVIEEGYIEKGDIFHKIASHPNSISIHSLFWALFDKGFSESQQILQMASRLIPLSQVWKDKAAKRLA